LDSSEATTVAQTRWRVAALGRRGFGSVCYGVAIVGAEDA